MTDEIKQVLRDLAAVFAGGLISFIVQHWRSPQDRRDTHVDRQQGIIEKQAKTLDDAFAQIEEIQLAMRKAERLQRVLWSYVINLLEVLRDNRVLPPDPPIEIATDPDIIRLTKSKKL